MKKDKKNIFDLSGRKALITGSCRGIGKAIAKGLADQGASVVVHGVTSMDVCKNVALEIGENAMAAICDLSDEHCAKELYEQTGDIDILVLNASMQYRKEWDKITSEEFEKQIRVNLKSSLELMQMYTHHMKEQKWGRIIAIGSVQQYKPHKDMMVYAATKSAQMNFMKNIAKQLAPYGITANNIAPGVIATSRNEAALADIEYRKKLLENIPLGYEGSAYDCTGAAILLCSDEGRYITGCDIVVDGGMRL